MFEPATGRIVATTSQYAGMFGAAPAAIIRADVTVVFATRPAPSSALQAGSAAAARNVAACGANAQKQTRTAIAAGRNTEAVRFTSASRAASGCRRAVF